jgi:PPP family 3-phenylpropionic acid transporter
MTGAPPTVGSVVDRRLRGLFALVWTVFSAFLPFFVLWLGDRGMSPSRIGLVLSSSALVGVAAAPLWSNIADRRSATVGALQVAFASSAAVAV